MSSALVRQALDFVDPEEQASSRGRRRSARKQTGQERNIPYKRKQKKATTPQQTDSADIEKDNIRKLLALSKPIAEPAIAEKIVKRAAKGKPLLEKVEVKVDEEKSILFADEPQESFKKFEREYFCS